MDYEKNVCPVLKVDGVLATGKQFDIDITLPEDNGSIIYGIVKDCYQDPVANAVVKLIEVVCEYGKEERRPVSHTFTDKNGEFVFGPLCANRFYEIQIWVNNVKHCRVCTKGKHEGKCLKGVKLDCAEKYYEKKDEKEDNDYYDKSEKEDYHKHYDRPDDKECNKQCDKPEQKPHNPCERQCNKH